MHELKVASLIFGFAALFCGAAVTGCATKTRNVELNGMYVSESGMLAIGSVDVAASPVGEESASIKYAEDTAWLSPSTKTHSIKIMLCGTNAVESVTGIVESICTAFIATAPYASSNAVQQAVSRQAQAVEAAQEGE